MSDFADLDIELPPLGFALYGMQTRVPPETEGHWRAAAEGRFTVPTCDDCGTNRWPLDLVCYACGSNNWSWQTVPGTGTVFTYTWIDNPTHPGGEGDNVAVIELDGTKGDPVRVPGWVVGATYDELACGLPVVADFEIVADGIGVPFWKPEAGD